jgi:tetratricopeptide (TPR) repeat protein
LIASGKHELLDLGRPSNAERDFRRAAAVDPWSVEPAELLSQLFYQRSLVASANRDADFDRSLEWQQQAISRNPGQAAEYRLLGELYLLKLASSNTKSAAMLAADAFQQAALLYPNHAQTQSELAEALWKAGRNQQARSAARQAIALDSINEQAGHIDKRLAADRRELMTKILQPPVADPN